MMEGIFGEDAKTGSLANKEPEPLITTTKVCSSPNQNSHSVVVMRNVREDTFQSPKRKQEVGGFLKSEEQ